MTENNSLTKYTFEISHALFRLCAHAKNPRFQEAVEPEVWGLLKNVLFKEYESAALKVRALEHIILLAGDLNFIHQIDAEFIGAELKKLNSAIEIGNNPAKLPDYDFPHDLFGKLSKENEYNSAKHSAKNEEDIESLPNSSMEEQKDNVYEDKNRQEIRQSAILEKIRQIGDCRIRDLLDHTPGSSERTIRNDLQSLVERGLVERIGNVGPGTFYRVRADAPLFLAS